MLDEKEEVKKQENAIVEIEVAEIPENGEEKITNVIEISEMSMEDLILEMNHFSENGNILSVSKRAEEVRSLFYQKLKQIQKEEVVEDITETEESTKTEEKLEKSPLHPTEVSFRKAYNKFKSEKAKHRKVKQDQEQTNLEEKRQIIEKIDTLTTQEESIKKTFEQFRVLQDKWKSIGYVPITENNNLWQSYHHHVELFYDYIKLNRDLRDLDFKRNLEEKTIICEKAEVLKAEKSLNKMHESLQELHEHWKNIGPVEKEQRDVIWDRFQTATKVLHKKRNNYFLHKKQETDKKLKEKNGICELIDNLTNEMPTSHNAWQKLIAECRKLEEKWKTIGRLSKKDNTKAWHNLRTALNNFYEKKNDFYKNRKQDTVNVIATKTTICEKAEALQDNTNWKETSQQLIQLQEDWKNAGFLPNHLTNKLWKRFKTACNTFFNGKKAHFKDLDKAKEGNLKAKQNLLKEVEKFIPTEDGKADFKTLNGFTKEWKKYGFVPRNKQSIEQDFEKTINKHYDGIKLDQKEIAKEKFKNKITAINGNQSKLVREQELIRTKIDDVKKIITQYENNISFFGKSRSNESLKKEVENKIESEQKEVEDLKERLKIIAQH